MKIAQIAPIIERVPPKKYGGTERVIHALTEELVKRGHDVTLFATEDSLTSANLQGTVTQGLREANVTDGYTKNGFIFSHIGEAYGRADEFDIIHDHVGAMSLATAHSSHKPVVMTLHGAFADHNRKLFEQLNHPYFVTISDAQAKTAPKIHRMGTIYNGLEMQDYPFRAKHDNYLLYVGRVTPLKGTHLAVQLAHQLKTPLKIAAKLEPENLDYFNQEIAPYLSDSIQWIGEVNEAERNRLMSQAKCFLHPATWEEPFGLTLIEAMACGCPVVALNHGSIPEVIEQGKTGFVVDDLDQMKQAVLNIDQIDRFYCRAYALNKFPASNMADKYEYLYYLILNQNASQKATSINYQDQMRPLLSLEI
jgi:glycosyltransferase involved in cell wall biosynthesis